MYRVVQKSENTEHFAVTHILLKLYIANWCKKLYKVSNNMFNVSAMRCKHKFHEEIMTMRRVTMS